MKLTITISTDNAAFDPAGHELFRILGNISDRTYDWDGQTPLSLPLYDANGNNVGQLEASE